jgi:hypothetical protein
MLQGLMYNGPTFTNDWSPNGNSFIEIFLHCFPCSFLEIDMVEATNNALLAVNGVRTTFGELLRYIGMMMLMSCYMKSPDYFWRTAVRTGDCLEDEENDMPLFTFNRYMSRRRYAAITSALRFTIKPPPSFRDKFWRGTSTCRQSLLQHGLYASTSQCPSGTTNGLALGGCFVHGNQGQLVMNTIQHAVDCRASCS